MLETSNVAFLPESLRSLQTVRKCADAVSPMHLAETTFFATRLESKIRIGSISASVVRRSFAKDLAGHFANGIRHANASWNSVYPQGANQKILDASAESVADSHQGAVAKKNSSVRFGSFVIVTYIPSRVNLRRRVDPSEAQHNAKPSRTLRIRDHAPCPTD